MLTERVDHKLPPSAAVTHTHLMDGLSTSLHTRTTNLPWSQGHLVRRGLGCLWRCACEIGGADPRHKGNPRSQWCCQCCCDWSSGQCTSGGALWLTFSLPCITYIAASTWSIHLQWAELWKFKVHKKVTLVKWMISVSQSVQLHSTLKASEWSSLPNRESEKTTYIILVSYVIAQWQTTEVLCRLNQWRERKWWG